MTEGLWGFALEPTLLLGGADTLIRLGTNTEPARLLASISPCLGSGNCAALDAHG